MVYLFADSINDIADKVLNQDTGIPGWIFGVALIVWVIRMSFEEKT
jgi:hypothetical protein